MARIAFEAHMSLACAAAVSITPWRPLRRHVGIAPISYRHQYRVDVMPFICQAVLLVRAAGNLLLYQDSVLNEPVESVLQATSGHS